MPRPVPNRQAVRYITVRRRVERLLSLLRNHRDVVILTHNDPDPDSISSAWGLSWLLESTLQTRSSILYGGMIGRAENRAMVELLRIPLKRATPADLEAGKPILLVDTQPGIGNNLLPVGAIPLAAIDHHPPHANNAGVPFRDIQPRFGATATIITRYLWAMGVEPPPLLATALFYGIKTDTLGLSREASRADALAYLYLHERADLPALGAIERAQLSRDYFVVMSRALRRARLYGNAVVTMLGTVGHADMAAEVADLLARLQGAEWVLSIAVFGDEVILSLRTTDPELNAGQVIQRLVAGSGSAGGHGTAAGGRIRFSGSPASAQKRVAQRFAEIMGFSSADAKPLI
ncbi:MAG: DHHA1 domain-containing protein [Anaerolineae bacterium]|nr:DHHA1 domain-containing protein [Anaerolineae bacterium]